MSGLPGFFEAPPFEWDMPYTVMNVTIGIILAVTLFFVVCAVTAQRRTGSPFYLLLFVGGAAAVFNEPIADLLGHCWHPAINIPAFTTFGRPIPLWVVLAYPPIYGGWTALVLWLLHRRFTRNTVWLGAGILFAIDAVAEIIWLRFELYTYYGYQPFRIGGFPVFWVLINGSACVAMAVVLARFPRWFSGWKAWFIVPMVPFAQFFGLALGIPAFSLINTNLEGIAVWAAAGLTIVLGLGVIELLSRLAPAEEAAGVSSEATPSRVDVPADVVSAASTTSRGAAVPGAVGF